MASQRFAFGRFVLDIDRGLLTRDERTVAVSGRGLALLNELLRAGGKPVRKTQLMDAAWPDLAVEESNLSVQIAALRKLLGPAPDGEAWIATVPRVGYRFAGEITPDTPVPGDPTPPARPSIAVMPFANVGGDADQEYFVDGITDDIIMALARFRWFRVASRGTTFAYKGRPQDPRAIAGELGVAFLLEGSVRRTGTRMRVSAQLVEFGGGTTVWAEHYDLEDAAVFAVQDAIAERVAGAVEPELLKRDSIQVAPHTGNVTAWDLVRQGTWLFHKVTGPTHLEARRLFREACALDPMLPEAQVWRARVNAGLIAYGWSSDPEADRQEGLEAGLRAIYLDGQNPYSHYALAIVSAYAGRAAQAMLAAERAIELSPSFALGHLVLGLARLFGGDAVGAVAPLAHGLELNPHDPQNPAWLNLLALAQFFAGDVDAARDTAQRGVKVRPDWRPTLLTLACCHAAMDEWDEARRFAALADDLPDLAGDTLDPLRRLNPAWDTRIRGLLARIG